MKDSATQSYSRPDENFPLNNTYQPITHDSRSYFPGHDNGFNFEAAQRQPLLRHHGDDVDGSGPESRRRLVASSMYDNFDDLPTTTSPNRNANVTGLTTAEVTQNPEMIEMSPMETRVVNPVTSTAPLDESNHPRSTNAGDELPYSPSEDSTIPLSQPSSISSHHHPPDTSSPNTEIYHPLVDSQLSPPPSPTEDLDFEKYTAPPPPVLPLSHSNSSPLRNTPAPNSTAPAAAAAAADTPLRFPTSNSMPLRLVNNNIDTNRDPSNIHSSLPHNHNNSSNPSDNVPTSNSGLPIVSNHRSPSTSSDRSLPSYDTAIQVITNGVTSNHGDEESDDGVDSQSGNNPSSTPEDLHISEEDDLGLSAENLPRGSFNSSAYPSRQPSIDTDGSLDYNDRYNRRRRFSAEKQQSEDILQPEPFWKRSVLYGQSPRSQSLDMPPTDKANGTGSNHLDSTVSGNQNRKQDGHIRNNSGNYHHHQHPDDVFDPNDDSTPWDPERQQQQQQTCNSNYSNLLDGERDRLNRLKDVCPDQPAIPI